MLLINDNLEIVANSTDELGDAVDPMNSTNKQHPNSVILPRIALRNMEVILF